MFHSIADNHHSMPEKNENPEENIFSSGKKGHSVVYGCGVHDQMKATDLYTGEQGDHFVIVTGSDDSGTDTAEKGSSTDTASQSKVFH